MFHIHIANNCNPIQLNEVYWIEDNQGCARHQSGEFRYSRVKVPIKKKGKKTGEEIIDLPVPFSYDGPFFRCNSYRKARRAIQHMCNADKKLKLEWFHINSARFMVRPNNRRNQRKQHAMSKVDGQALLLKAQRLGYLAVGQQWHAAMDKHMEAINAAS